MVVYCWQRHPGECYPQEVVISPLPGTPRIRLTGPLTRWQRQDSKIDVPRFCQQYKYYKWFSIIKWPSNYDPTSTVRRGLRSKVEGCLPWRTDQKETRTGPKKRNTPPVKSNYIKQTQQTIKKWRNTTTGRSAYHWLTIHRSIQIVRQNSSLRQGGDGGWLRGWGTAPWRTAGPLKYYPAGNSFPTV